MNIDKWLFESRNNGSSYERACGINSLKEFKLKIVYICIVGEIANNGGEAFLSYDNISELVEKYSAGTMKITRASIKRMVDELVGLSLITKENDLKGKISKNLYKANK